MKRILFLLICLVLHPGIGLAQETASSEGVNPEETTNVAALGQSTSTSEDVQKVDEIIITATGTEEQLKKTSVSSTVITAPEIEKRQVTRVEEMLRSVPGVVVNQTGSQGGNTSLFMRGGNSNMSQVLLNGIRLNNAGGTYDWANLTVDNVERIEVVRGPMSSLYGADAMTGVTNLITKKGVGPPTFTYSGAWGAHSEKGQFISENRFSLMGSAKDRFGYSIGFSRIDDQGILPINNRFGSNVLNGRFDLDPTEKLSFTFSTLFIDTYFGYPTEYGDRVDPAPDPNQNQTRTDLLFGLTTKYSPYSWWENELTLSTYHRDWSYDDAFDPVDIFGGSVFHPIEDRSSLDYRSNLRFNFSDRIGTTTTIGLAAFTERLKQSYESFGVWPYSSETRAHRRSVDFYFQEQISFWERLFLTAGMRLEDNTAFDGTEFSPRASAAFRITETDTTLRAAGGRAIKAPTFSEQYYQSTTAVGNPNLKPEKNTSWEVGVDQYALNDRLKFGLTYFENHFTDLIAYITRAWPATSFYGNISDARVRGLETSLTAKPLPYLTLSASYTYLLSQVLSTGGEDLGLNYEVGKPLVRRPKHTVSFTINYDHKPFNVNLNGLYVGKRDDFYYITDPFFVTHTGRVFNPSYLLFNLAATYDIAENLRYAKKMQLQARIGNLFDQNYQETYNYSSPGFNFVTGLRFVF
ncbi:TonB-dependent receptor plug domain-containing protein [Desulfobacca acetoxidans]|uniref:TonB-dependent receptor n=1 Tax=Desulfobacca acetoxidans (strain ATCC 700848 / DSM 11109 / ASRB2) TaxID=880072 RepID=F2NG62_DESAR|nr:TonB-dependent receptor [Desulfobacca acetoxidans]AEB08475.1 TonB-dependent receptor [Desulfobacca acetoxidans DSM 11109]